MTSDLARENTDQKPEIHGQQAQEEPQNPSLAPAVGGDPNPKEDPQPPDSAPKQRDHNLIVAYSTLIVLSLTLVAAIYAGIQAGRLADLTQTAVNDANENSVRQSESTREALRLTGEQAEATRKLADAAAVQADAAAAAAQTARDSMVASQRAWVGPGNVSLVGEPKFGEKLEIVIEYSNTGREPALDFASDLDLFIATATVAGSRILPFMGTCLKKEKAEAGQVMYPTSGFSHYTLNDTLLPQIDEMTRLLDKKDIFFVQGCFTYVTEEETRHSFFCYFFDPTVSKIANLNICVFGHHAD